MNFVRKTKDLAFISSATFTWRFWKSRNKTLFLQKRLLKFLNNLNRSTFSLQLNEVSYFWQNPQCKTNWW